MNDKKNKVKKIKSIIVSTLITVVVIGLLVGLGMLVYSINYNYRKYEFKLDNNSIDIHLGSEGRVPISLVSGESISYDDFIYTSTDTNIIDVDEDGNITPINNGKAKIMVKAKKSNQSSMLDVNVVLLGSFVNIDDIIVESQNINLKVGETYSIKVDIVPSNSSYNSIIWSSSNTSIASVVGGVVSARMEGNCIIYVKCGNIKKEINVSVFKS